MYLYSLRRKLSSRKMRRNSFRRACWQFLGTLDDRLQNWIRPRENENPISQRKQRFATMRARKQTEVGQRFHFEPLEVRAMLSGEAFVFDSSAYTSGFDLKLTFADSKLKLVDQNQLVVKTQNLADNDGRAIITGSDYADKLSLDASLASISSFILPHGLSIAFSGGQGNDTLVGPNAINVWNVTRAIFDAPLMTLFFSIE